MPNLLVWNVRGLNEVVRQFEAKALLKKFKISVAVFLETRIKEVNKDRVLEGLRGWCWKGNYDHAYNGRIWVMWDRKQVNLVCLAISDQLMHCKVSVVGATDVFYATFVYAFNEQSDRVPLWRDIRRFGIIADPWIIVGDLNTTLFPDEPMRKDLMVEGDLSELVSLVEDLSLVDLRYTGNRLTWCNNREGDSRLYCKLDRAMVNAKWLSMFDTAEAIFLAPGTFDHCPCLIRMRQEVVFGNHIFRFCDMWAKDSAFQGIISSCWNVVLKGTPMFRLVKKLKYVKHGLKNLHRSEYENISARVNMHKHQLDRVQTEMRIFPDNDVLIGEEKILNEAYQNSVRAEMLLLKQKTKAQWLIQNDTNSAFFHASVKEKNVKAKITSIHDEDGHVLTDMAEVREEFIRYYEKLLGSNCVNKQPVKAEVLQNGPCLSDEQHLHMCRPISDLEIKEAIFSIPDGKSPGPDGFSSGFFKAGWNIIGNEVCSAIRSFFNSGKLLKEVNATLIIVIPKNECPMFVSDYKPIACCNVLYKAITKILTNRMQTVMGGIINETQGAFVKKRSIMDNILVCQGLVRNYNREGGAPRCLMKLDLCKAYDTIDWDFIEEVMTGLNFPKKFSQWVLECVRTPMFSILLNGRPHGFFRSKRGIRQGDPMSPYLFVLGMEYFSRLLEGLHSNNGFHYHFRCKNMQLTHLSFADDMMLVSRADLSSTKLLKDNFDEFSGSSGLQINLQNSEIFFVGTEHEVRGGIMEQLGFKEGHLPVRYLGVPLIASKLSKNDCQPILDKFMKKINNWSAKCLSYAGRVQLAKSVLLQLQVFWCNIFILPKAVIHELEKLASRYIWNGSTDHKPLALVSWKSVTLPKNEGGLGIRQLDAWNKAAVGKMLWKVINRQDCLWTKWVNSAYLKGRNIWQIAISPDYPWSWRKLLKLRTEFQRHTKVLIGDGRQTSLFYDDWLDCGPLIHIIGEEEVANWGLSLTVNDWWNDNNGWKIPRSFVRRFRELATLVQAVRIRNVPDIVVWSHSPTGAFTVDRCYHDLRLRGPKVSWDGFIWSGKIPPKYSFIMWLFMRNRMKTKDLLIHRGLMIDPQCELCISAPETQAHMFFQCDSSSSVWTRILIWCGVQPMPANWNIMTWTQTNCRGRGRKANLLKSALAVVVYTIWHERNMRCFQQKIRNILQVSQSVISILLLLKCTHAYR